MQAIARRNTRSKQRHSRAAVALVAVAFGLTSAALAQKGGALMAVPGAFEVGAHGEASYTIPIAVPPGTSGMEPKIADIRGQSRISQPGWLATAA
jgi:hypothetical protein